MKLSLHRSGLKPDWLPVPKVRRNRWQRLAAWTNGIVTPGNAITFIGGILSLCGIGVLLLGHEAVALVLLVTGRLLDIADGIVADRTGTKSSLGELLDATTDKIVTILTGAALFISQVAPFWLLVLFVLPHILTSIIVIAGRKGAVRVHPSRLGKTSMLLAWIAVALLLVVKAADAPPAVTFLVYAFTGLQSLVGLYSSYTYIKR